MQSACHQFLRLIKATLTKLPVQQVKAYRTWIQASRQAKREAALNQMALALPSMSAALTSSSSSSSSFGYRGLQLATA